MRQIYNQSDLLLEQLITGLSQYEQFTEHSIVPSKKVESNYVLSIVLLDYILHPEQS